MKQIQKLVEDIAKIAGLPISRQQANEMQKDYFLHIEYARHYGGYRVVNVNVKHGGHSGAFGESASCGRRSKGQMIDFLTGYLNAIS